MAGSSAASSTMWSGQPYRALACSATAESGRQVLSAPDEGRGHRDPLQHLGGNGRQAELLHDLMQRGLALRRAHPLQAVAVEGLPSLAHVGPKAIEVERAVAPQAVERGLVRPREECGQRAAEFGRRVERCQAQRVHQHQSCDPVAVTRREPGRDGAADHVAEQHSRHRRGPVEQLTQPLDHVVRRQCAPIDGRGAMTGQVGSDNPMPADQLGDHPQPLERMFARAVQQHERRSVPTLQHRRRDSGQLVCPFRHGKAVHQPFTGIHHALRHRCLQQMCVPKLEFRPTARIG